MLYFVVPFRSEQAKVQAHDERQAHGHVPSLTGNKEVRAFLEPLDQDEEESAAANPSLDGTDTCKRVRCFPSVDFFISCFSNVWRWTSVLPYRVIFRFRLHVLPRFAVSLARGSGRVRAGPSSFVGVYVGGLSTRIRNRAQCSLAVC